MKQFVITMFFTLCSTMVCQAQTYLEHIQQNTPGLGKVTVNQSKAIDELVNGSNIVKPQDVKTKTQQPLKNNETPHKTTEPQHKATEPQHKATEPQHKALAPDSLKKNEQHNAAEGNKAAAQKPEANKNAQKAENKEETEMPIVDMRKKMMRKSYKVTGYRVQVFAGGNSRNDRLKAEQTGNALKMSFPEQPVYVHFYSPRWICRMGNFRSLGEAQKFLSKVKAMGYRQACLVKGQITVQY